MTHGAEQRLQLTAAGGARAYLEPCKERSSREA
jgi:hypothetical protein